MEMGIEPRARSRFIEPHKAAVANDIGSQDGGKPSLNAFSRHFGRVLLGALSGEFYGVEGAKSISAPPPKPLTGPTLPCCLTKRRCRRHFGLFRICLAPDGVARTDLHFRASGS
jgi:hypothetical protein